MIKACQLPWLRLPGRWFSSMILWNPPIESDILDITEILLNMLNLALNIHTNFNYFDQSCIQVWLSVIISGKYSRLFPTCKSFFLSRVASPFSRVSTWSRNVFWTSEIFTSRLDSDTFQFHTWLWDYNSHIFLSFLVVFYTILRTTPFC